MHVRRKNNGSNRQKRVKDSIEEAPLPIMLYTENGDVKKINRKWAEITGYNIKDMSTISEWSKTSDVFTERLEGDNVNKFSYIKQRHENGEYIIRTS